MTDFCPHCRRPMNNVAGMSFDDEQRTVTVSDMSVKFSRKEYEVFKTVVDARGAVATASEILLKVWPGRKFIDPIVVPVHVYRVRRKLKPLGIEIENVHGVGYFLPLPSFDEAVTS